MIATNIKLTIVIPTFNREKRLLNQLQSIYRQSKYKDIYIVILDNASEYDIEASLKAHFSEEELSILELIKRPFNIGMIGNMSNTFLYSKTDWMWLLSDDDEVTMDSLEIIFSKIDLYPNSSVLKFSIDGIQSEENVTVNSIDSFIKYYKNSKRENSTGNLIFMSNNIFNVKVLSNYIEDNFSYSYTYIPHIMPILSSIINNNGEVKYFSESIVKFILPESGIEWNFAKGMLGLCTLNDFFLTKEVSSFQRKQLLKVFTQSFDFYSYIRSCNKFTYKKRMLIYTKIYNGFYKFRGSFKIKILYHIFLLIFFFNINIKSIVRGK